MQKTLRLYTPIGEPSNPTGELAKRPKSLNGLKIGILDNGKEFSDVVLERLAETLRSGFGATEIEFWRKGYPAKLAPFIQEMSDSCDVAISGVGHCGSSSPWSVHDSVALERAGVPTVTLISRSFCRLGQIVATGLGFPFLPIVMLSHPIGDPDPELIRSKGSSAAESCVRLLTTPATQVTTEFISKKFPLPEHVVARR